MKTFIPRQRTHTRAALASFAIALLLLSASLVNIPAQLKKSSRATASKPGTVIFVVSSEGDEKWMGPLVFISGGRYQEPTGGLEGKDVTPFVKNYLRAGQKYRLLFGGGEAGSLTVKKEQQGCNNITASVDVTTESVKLGGHVMALATNSATLGQQPVSRRAPTDAERDAVMQLVQNIYKQNRTPPASLAKLQTINLTATDLNADGTPEMVGSFRIESGNPAKAARRDLFLIAHRQGQSYTAELAEFQSYQLIDGFGRGVDFVDQLDLDGDHQAEVVTVNEGYDGYNYSIYKKQGRRWRSVYSGGGDAC